MFINVTKIVRSFAFLAFLYAGIPSAHAQIPVTDFAGLVEWVLSLETAYEQLSEAKTMVDQGSQVVNQTTNTANSLQNPLGTSLNSSQMGELRALRNSTSQTNTSNGITNGLSGTVSDVAAKLKNAYGSDSNGNTGSPKFETYMGATKDTIRGATTNNAAALDNMDSEASRLDNLVSQSQGATGALQAQQAGNQINAELASQIQKQRQQQAIQAQADNASALAQQQQKQDDAAITGMFLGKKQ